jgi:hypothetical protein
MEALTSDILFIFNKLTKVYFQIDEELIVQGVGSELFWHYVAVKNVQPRVAKQITFDLKLRAVFGAVFYQLVARDLTQEDSYPYFDLISTVITGAVYQYGKTSAWVTEVVIINLNYIFRTIVNETRTELGKAPFSEKKKF